MGSNPSKSSQDHEARDENGVDGTVTQGDALRVTIKAAYRFRKKVRTANLYDGDNRRASGANSSDPPRPALSRRRDSRTELLSFIQSQKEKKLESWQQIHSTESEGEEEEDESSVGGKALSRLGVQGLPTLHALTKIKVKYVFFINDKSPRVTCVISISSRFIYS